MAVNRLCSANFCLIQEREREITSKANQSKAMNHCELYKTHEKTNAGSHGAHVSGLSSNYHYAKRVARYGGELSSH